MKNTRFFNFRIGEHLLLEMHAHGEEEGISIRQLVTSAVRRGVEDDFMLSNTPLMLCEYAVMSGSRRHYGVNMRSDLYDSAKKCAEFCAVSVSVWVTWAITNYLYYASS